MSPFYWWVCNSAEKDKKEKKSSLSLARISWKGRTNKSYFKKKKSNIKSSQICSQVDTLIYVLFNFSLFPLQLTVETSFNRWENSALNQSMLIKLHLTSVADSEMWRFEGDFVIFILISTWSQDVHTTCQTDGISQHWRMDEVFLLWEVFIYLSLGHEIETT